MAEPVKIPFLPEYGGFTNAPTTSGLSGVLAGLGITPEEIAALTGSKTTQTGGAAKPSSVEYPRIYSDTEANGKIRDIFKSLLDRDPTAAELNKWRPLLIAAQKKNVSSQTYKIAGGKGVQTTLGGLDENEWLTEQLQADPAYKDELSKIALTPSSIAQKAKDKQLYMDALAAAGKDQSKIQALNQNTAYGLAISGLKNRIQTAADQAGANYDEASLMKWAQEAYDTNQDANPYTFNKFLNNKFSFTGAGYKGEALNNFNTLRDVAIANGIDINKAFGSQLPTWLNDLNKGANIDQYKQMIRDVAKIGMPEKVSKLMDQGIDLKTIYAPYQNMMENVLELPQGSITLDDPTLRAAITSEGEVPLYQFERNLRQDNRWQYTNTAKQEVSSAVNKVLKDFGFQG